MLNLCANAAPNLDDGSPQKTSKMYAAGSGTDAELIAKTHVLCSYSCDVFAACVVGLRALCGGRCMRGARAEFWRRCDGRGGQGMLRECDVQSGFDVRLERVCGHCHGDGRCQHGWNDWKDGRSACGCRWKPDARRVIGSHGWSASDGRSSEWYRWRARN